MIEDLNNEIQKICDDLVKEAEMIAQLPSVSHLSKSKVQFVGGILGGVQEYREGKRLEKLANTPICKDWTFYTYAFHLIEVAEELVKKQLEVQSATTENDKCYYDNVKLIVESVKLAHRAWYRYSPDMAREGITIGDTKNVSLELSVDTYTNEEFHKLQLPKGMYLPPQRRASNDEGGGCFGMLLLLLIIGGICAVFI